MKGFTLVESLIALAIIIILVSLAFPVFRYFQREADLNDNTEGIVNVLRLARAKTLASEGSSQWGVYFSTAVFPHQCTLFKGPNYASRDDSFDEIYNLKEQNEIYEIDLNGGGTEVVFDRISGKTNQNGNISLRLKDNVSEARTISIQPSGQTTAGEEVPPIGSDFIADSRHVHIDYSRNIDTDNEQIKLTFQDPPNPDTIKEINIKDYLDGGQIYWEVTVDVGGEEQVIKIHTHWLNTPNTQFCIHRDRRYNNKALIVELSGDVSGDIITYSADGYSASFNSIHVIDEPEWQ